MQLIRMATEADGAACAAIYAPIVVDTTISFEVEPPTAEQLAARIGATLSYAPWLVLEREGQVAGYVYASKHRERAAYQWSVDVSAYTDPRFYRRGIGATLYRTLFALLRIQGFYAAHAGITLPNPTSVAFHEALGFTPIGVYPQVGYKLGAWRDVGWWQLALQPRPAVPTPPLSLAEAQRLPAFQTILGLA
jgi:phosphinothricin acetyltransferase